MRKCVLWGHHISEYESMFSLSKEMYQGKLLEYGSGPSAVNAELHQHAEIKSPQIISIDPLFSLDTARLKQEATALFELRKQEIIAKPEQFNMSAYGGMDAFFETRKAGMDLFFQDYAKGVAQNRYQKTAVGQKLAFEHGYFDLALCSHYLFAASTNQSIDFHLETLLELSRVAKEVRIFPLIERAGEPSTLLGPVLLGLQQANLGVELKEVPCELYPQGNAMLRVWANTCEF